MHSKLSSLRGLLAAVLVAAAGVVASANVPTPGVPGNDLQEFVREQWARTAVLQMQTYRWEVDELVRALPPEDPRYAPAYNLIQRGEQLIHRLRSAHPGEIFPLQAEYERNRAELDRVLGRDRMM